MEKISPYQLGVMIIMFEIGSSPLFLLASEAKRDAWISVLIAMVCGMLLLVFITLRIQRLEPGLNLIDILLRYCGRWLGQLLAWPYIIYFLYKSVRNVREFGDLMNLYLLPDSPLVVVIGIIMLLSAYAVYKGVEVFFRVTEVLLPIITVIYFFLLLLIVIVGDISLYNLLPIMEDGLGPVVSAALPEVISFPFGEMVLFLMYWKFVNEKKTVLPATLISYTMAGLFLVITNAMILSILEPGMAGAGGIPLMIIASLIRITQFTERMDPLVAILLFIGVWIKQTAYYLGAAMALASIFKTSYQRMTLPAGLVIFTGSLMFGSYMEQIRFGFEYNIKYHFPIFQIMLPMLLLLVMIIKKKRKHTPPGQDKTAPPQKNKDPVLKEAAPSPTPKETTVRPIHETAGRPIHKEAASGGP